MIKLRIVTAISMVSAFLAANYFAAAQDVSPQLLSQVRSQRGANLNESVFAIMTMQDAKRETMRLVGSAFVIRQNPLTLLTCYHVVSGGSETNDGSLIYFIGKRIHAADEFDLTKESTAHFLPLKRLIFKPEYDLAILEIDPAVDPEISSKLSLSDVKPLDLDFDRAQRAAGTAVMWLTIVPPNAKDLRLLPRLEIGNIVTSYVTHQSYSFKSSSGASNKQIMNAVRILETDKLILPGASGSAIVSVATNKVIGYLHGLFQFPIPSGVEVTEDIQLSLGLVGAHATMKRYPQMISSRSLGVDLRSTEGYLKQAGYVSN